MRASQLSAVKTNQANQAWYVWGKRAWRVIDQAKRSIRKPPKAKKTKQRTKWKQSLERASQATNQASNQPTNQTTNQSTKQISNRGKQAKQAKKSIQARKLS